MKHIGKMVLSVTAGMLCLAWPAAAWGQAAGNKYAFLVGVKKYDHSSFPNLQHTENDVVKLAEVLRPLGYKVVLLCDRTGERNPAFLPTRDNILNRLKALLALCKRDDTILVGFAGHGLQFHQKKTSYICPSDANPFQVGRLISLEDLYRELEECGAGVKLVLIDACRDDPASARGRGLDGANAPRPPRGVSVLFSCSPGQRAFESDKLGHGIFFHFVLEGFRGAAKNRRGEITWDSLASFVREEVSQKVGTLVNTEAEQAPNLVADLIGAPPLLVSRVVSSPTPAPVPATVPAPVRHTVTAELCLPDDFELLAAVNIRTLLDPRLPYAAALPSNLPGPVQPRDLAGKMDRLLLSLADNKEFVLLAEGELPTAEIRKTITGQQVAGLEGRVWSTGENAYLGLADDRLLLGASSLEQAKQILQRRSSGRTKAFTPWGEFLRKQVNGQATLSVAIREPLKCLQRLSPQNNLDESTRLALQKVQAATLHLHLGLTHRAELVAFLPSEDEAGKARVTIESGLDLLRKAMPNAAGNQTPPWVLELLKNTRCTCNRTTVTVSTSLSQQRSRELDETLVQSLTRGIQDSQKKN